MSSAAPRVGAFCGALVGVCSALLTATAHAAGGGSLPQGAGALMLAVVCATVGAVTGTVSARRGHAPGRGVLAAGLLTGQATSHLLLTAVDHHGAVSAMPSPPMVIAHVAVAAALAALIGAAGHAVSVCASVLAWLAVIFVHRGRPTAPAGFAPVRLLRARMLRCTTRMRAPPRIAFCG